VAHTPGGEAPRLPRWAFAAGVIGGVLAVWALVLLTDLRAVMHTVLLAAATVAFLPFVLTLAAIAIVVVAGFVASVATEGDGIESGAAAEGIAHGGRWLARVYYRFAWRQRRSPVVWGLCGGLGLGAAGVWSTLAISVVPRETQTLSILLQAQTKIDAMNKHPEAASDGLLRPRLWGAIGAERDAPVLDGFERPIRYSRQGAWLATSYTLESLGYDGEPSADDLCVGGQTALARVLERVRDPLRLLEELHASELGWSQRAEVLTLTRCSHQR
jgi:hypothetical protein